MTEEPRQQETTARPPLRICVYGPESTGKTSLAKYLAAKFEAPYMPEYGRIFDEEFSPKVWLPEHFVTIAKTHEQMRKALMADAREVLIEDTDPVLTAVWCEAFVGHVDPWFDRDFELADLYLLTNIDVPWISDGLRMFGKEEERARFFARAKEELERRGAPYVLISGNWEARERQAEALVQQVIDASGHN